MSKKYSATPERLERQRAELDDMKKKYLANFLKLQQREKQQMNQQMKLDRERETLDERLVLEQSKKDLELERQKRHEEKISLSKFYMEQLSEKKTMKAREAQREQMEEEHQRQIVMEKDNWAAMVRDAEAVKQRRLQMRQDIVADMLAKTMQHTQKLDQYAAEIELRRKQMEVLEQEKQRNEQQDLQKRYLSDYLKLQLREKERMNHQMKLDREREMLDERQVLERCEKDLELERQKRNEEKKIILRKFYMEQLLEKEAMKAREAEREQMEEEHQRQNVMEKDNWAAMVRDTEAVKQRQLQRRQNIVADMLAKKMQHTQKLDQHAAETELRRKQMEVLEQEKQRNEQRDLQKRYLSDYLKLQLREKERMNQQMKLDREREMLDERQVLERCEMDLELERQKRNEEKKIRLRKFYMEQLLEKEAMKAREAEREQMEEEHQRQIVMEKDNWAAMVRDTEAVKQRQLQRRQDIVADMLAKTMQHTQKLDQHAAEIELRRKQMEVLEQEKQRNEQRDLQKRYLSDYLKLQLREKERMNQQMKLDREREILDERQVLERCEMDLELERQKQQEEKKIILRKFYMEQLLEKEAMKAREAEREQMEEEHQRQNVMEKDNWAAMVRDTEAVKQRQLQRRQDIVADLLAKTMQHTQKLDQHAAETELRRKQMEVLEQERIEQQKLQRKYDADFMMLQLREKEQINQQMKLDREREILDQRQVLRRYKKDMALEKDNSTAVDRDTEAEKQIIRAERELERKTYFQQRADRIEMGCGPGPNTGRLRAADLAPGVNKSPDYVKSPNPKFYRSFRPKDDLESTKSRLGFV